MCFLSKQSSMLQFCQNCGVGRRKAERAPKSRCREWDEASPPGAFYRAGGYSQLSDIFDSRTTMARSRRLCYLPSVSIGICLANSGRNEGSQQTVLATLKPLVRFKQLFRQLMVIRREGAATVLDKNIMLIDVFT
jgi:hypothetical protein